VTVPGGDGHAQPAVRLGRAQDAEAVASLHARLIAEGFLSSLGPRFLSLLYRRVVRSAHSFLLVADDGEATAGFVAGADSVGRLYRDFMVRDGPAAVLAAPLRLLAGLPRVLETLRHGASGDSGRVDDGAGGGEPRRAAGGRGATAGPETSELLSIAVDPAWQGRGVGAELVTAFLHEVARRGGGRARVVVGAANEPAVALYHRAGFSAVRSFELHPGTESLLLEVAVPALDAS
jgi:ribosomal protein S18 acetylase RimI-like enzyme